MTGDWNESPCGTTKTSHKGYDINDGVNDEGDPIYAAFSGTVVDADDLSPVSYGKYVQIRHRTTGTGEKTTTKYETFYAHLKTINVSIGQTVERGRTVIGTRGDTGSPDTGAYHLHLEFRKRSDPLFTSELLTPSDRFGIDNVLGCNPGDRSVLERAGFNWSPSDFWVALRWYLNNNNDGDGGDPGDGEPAVFRFGRTNDVPLSGDWDGDGDDTPGYFRAPMFWCLSNNFDGDCTDSGEHDFEFGTTGAKPLVGDWLFGGIDLPAVVIGNTWFLNYGYDGADDFNFGYGSASDTQVVGDWDGCGVDTPGVIKEDAPAKDWYLNDNFDPNHWLLATFGNSDANPSYEAPGDDVPIDGDWDSVRCQGTYGFGDTLGVVRGNTWRLDNNFGAAAEVTFPYGVDLDAPIAGDWDNNNTDTSGIVKPALQ